MRRFLAALLLCVSISAQAEWVSVGKDKNGDAFFIDPRTIKKEGILGRVQTLTNFASATEDGDRSHRLLVEYDCKTERGRTLSLATFKREMARGAETHNGNFPNVAWEHIRAGTIDAAMMKRVCAR